MDPDQTAPCLFVCVYHGSDITTCTTSGLHFWYRYVMSSVMVSHIIIYALM